MNWRIHLNKWYWLRWMMMAICITMAYYNHIGSAIGFGILCMWSAENSGLLIARNDEQQNLSRIKSRLSSIHGQRSS